MPSVGAWVGIISGGLISLLIIVIIVLYIMSTSYKCDDEAGDLAVKYYKLKDHLGRIGYLDAVKEYYVNKDLKKKTCDVRFTTVPGPGSKMKNTSVDFRRFKYELDQNGDWYVSDMGEFESGKLFK